MQSVPSFTCPAYMDTNGMMKIANITYCDNQWVNFDIGPKGIFKKSGAYLVPSLPVSFTAMELENMILVTLMN